MGIIGYFAPYLISYNKSDISINQAMNMILISIIPLILFFLMQSRFVSVTVDNDHIKIDNYNEMYKWSEVTISQISFIFPPLYKLRIDNKKGFQLFNTDNKYLWVSVGIIKDVSSMGEFIKKKRGLIKPSLYISSNIHSHQGSSFQD